jgi:hypothetical protein
VKLSVIASLLSWLVLLSKIQLPILKPRRIQTEQLLPLKHQNLQHAGDLGNVIAGRDGRATFRLTDKVIKVWDIIGRSVVVTDGADDLGRGNHPWSLQDGNSGQRLVTFTKYFRASVVQNVSNQLYFVHFSDVKSCTNLTHMM